MNYQFTDRAVAESLFDSFQKEPFFLAISKQRSNQKESDKDVLLRYFDFSIQEARQYGVIYIPKNKSYGAAIWSKPLSLNLSQQKSKEKKQFLIDYMGTGSLEAYQKMAIFMDKKISGIIPEHYWYLSILGVAKSHQRKGYGIKLVQPILNQTDQLGIPTWLETFTEGNLHFYGKLGYEVAIEYLEPTLNKTCWVLVRKAC